MTDTLEDFRVEDDGWARINAGPPVTPLELYVRERALCKGSKSFQEGRYPKHTRARLHEMCMRCPVLKECAQWADEFADYYTGAQFEISWYWAGESPSERRRRRVAGLRSPYINGDPSAS